MLRIVKGYFSEQVLVSSLIAIWYIYYIIIYYYLYIYIYIYIIILLHICCIYYKIKEVSRYICIYIYIYIIILLHICCIYYKIKEVSTLGFAFLEPLTSLYGCKLAIWVCVCVRESEGSAYVWLDIVGY